MISIHFYEQDRDKQKLLIFSDGLDTGKIVADIAKNAKDTAKFLGGNVKALKNAAIQANKLTFAVIKLDIIIYFSPNISKMIFYK